MSYNDFWASELENMSVVNYIIITCGSWLYTGNYFQIEFSKLEIGPLLSDDTDMCLVFCLPYMDRNATQETNGRMQFYLFVTFNPNTASRLLAIATGLRPLYQSYLLVSFPLHGLIVHGLSNGNKDPASGCRRHMSAAEQRYVNIEIISMCNFTWKQIFVLYIVLYSMGGLWNILVPFLSKLWLFPCRRRDYRTGGYWNEMSLFPS